MQGWAVSICNRGSAYTRPSRSVHQIPWGLGCQAHMERPSACPRRCHATREWRSARQPENTPYNVRERTESRRVGLEKERNTRIPSQKLSKVETDLQLISAHKVLLVSSYSVETWMPVSANYYGYNVIWIKSYMAWNMWNCMHVLLILGLNKFLFQKEMWI